MTTFIPQPQFPGFERQWPQPDWELSPYTGLSRAHWEYVADGLLHSIREYASEDNAHILPPGTPGGYGSKVDGLEGFTRSFMLAAFRIAGDPQNTTELADWYLRGIIAGTDPDNPHRWLRPDEVDQAKVEAAALAMSLHLCRAQIWDRLPAKAQQNVIDYLATFIGGSRPMNNWVWFRIITEQFLANVGGPFSEQDMAEDLAIHDSFIRAPGWISDGYGRDFDHYCGWALQLYPLIWADMVPDPSKEDQQRFKVFSDHLAAYLQDYLHLIGADGSPLFQGRSLVYRFAAAAPLWMDSIAGTNKLAPGLVRRGASGILGYFLAGDVPDEQGLLNLGWFGPWRQMAQNYSGPGSPYWAAKGMIGLALPASHPVWQETEAPLPIDTGDFTRLLPAPGWAVLGSKDDGIVRVVNHGTDHWREGEYQFDPPLYARFNYSTATAPVLTPDAELDPMDTAVALQWQGRVSHRSGFTPGPIEYIDGAVVARSAGHAVWPQGEPQGPDHGDGRVAQDYVIGPKVSVISVCKGEWQVQIAIADGGSGYPVQEYSWYLSGWNLSDSTLTHELDEDRQLTITSATGVQSVLAIAAADAQTAQPQIRELIEATPLATSSAFPYVQLPLKIGEPVCAAIALVKNAASGMNAARGMNVSQAPTWLHSHGQVHVTWADGSTTRVRLREVQ